MSGDDRIFGPERWRSLGGQDWSWWDLWCCVIAVKDHDGDLTALAESIADKIRTERGPMFSSRSDDARLAQVLDLDQRLAAAGLDPGDLADRGVLRDRKITSRARAKFKANVPDGAYARTPAMLDLPRDRLERRARFGAWPEFPSDPAPFFDKFRPTIERRECTERQTRRVTHTLSDTLGHLDGPKRSLTDRLALYRAFYTAAAELADIADDSYGYLGDLWQETWPRVPRPRLARHRDRRRAPGETCASSMSGRTTDSTTATKGGVVRGARRRPRPTSPSSATRSPASPTRPTSTLSTARPNGQPRLRSPDHPNPNPPALTPLPASRSLLSTEIPSIASDGRDHVSPSRRRRSPEIWHWPEHELLPGPSLGEEEKSAETFEASGGPTAPTRR